MAFCFCSFVLFFEKVLGSSLSWQTLYRWFTGFLRIIDFKDNAADTEHWSVVGSISPQGDGEGRGRVGGAGTETMVQRC